MPKLYIAFGSNLSKKQMRFRCPTARPLGKFMLTSAQLVFRNVADLEFVPNAQTPCGLWSINAADEAALDRYEGIKAGAYFKSDKIVLNYCGRKQRALIYLMNSEAIYPPSQAYVDTIRKGYRDFDLDEKFLDEAIARSFRDKKPDQEVALRRRRQQATTTHRALAQIPEQVPDEVLIERMQRQAELELEQPADAEQNTIDAAIAQEQERDLLPKPELDARELERQRWQ